MDDIALYRGFGLRDSRAEGGWGKGGGGRKKRKLLETEADEKQAGKLYRLYSSLLNMSTTLNSRRGTARAPSSAGQALRALILLPGSVPLLILGLLLFLRFADSAARDLALSRRRTGKKRELKKKKTKKISRKREKTHLFTRQ